MPVRQHLRGQKLMSSILAYRPGTVSERQAPFTLLDYTPTLTKNFSIVRNEAS